MSTRPNSRSAAATVFSTSGTWETSASMTMARRPNFLTPAAVSSAPPRLMSTTTISAPRSAIRRAWARPMPSPAPVIKATLSVKACSFMLGLRRSGIRDQNGVGDIPGEIDLAADVHDRRLPLQRPPHQHDAPAADLDAVAQAARGVDDIDDAAGQRIRRGTRALRDLDRF